MENKSIQRILSCRKNNRSWVYIDLEQEDTIDVFHRFGELKIKSNNVEYIQDKSRQFIQNFPFPHIILTINKLSYLFNSSLVLQAHYNLRFLFYFSTKDTLTVPRSSLPLENHNRDMKKQPQVGVGIDASTMLFAPDVLHRHHCHCRRGTSYLVHGSRDLSTTHYKHYNPVELILEINFKILFE